MTLSVGTRIEVLGTLRCLGPVHIGGWDTTVEADLSVARDGAGIPCLPGTSIAGALRAYLTGIDRFEPHLNALFGHIVPYTTVGSPSWIRVDDAHLLDTDVTPVVRDGVGIDRRSATAAQGFLYTRQMLPVGTRFAVRLVADTPTTATAPQYPGGWPALVRDAVDTLVAGLTHARIPFGAGRGHGLGLVRLDECDIRTADLSDPAGLIAWLTGTAPPRTRLPATPDTKRDDLPADGHLRITIDWRPVGPLLVRDSLPGTVVDTLPLTDTQVDGTVRLLLPGSSIRGAIRAHAERIVRTLRCQDAPPDLGDTLRTPPPGVDLLFGAAPASSRGHCGNREDNERRGRRGALSVADCRSVAALSVADWNTVVTIHPAQGAPTGEEREEREDRETRNTERGTALGALHQHLDAINTAVSLGVSDHVAIDRWTGGAGDHRLFSVLEPDSTVGWEPISISVDVARLRRHPNPAGAAPAALALPLLLLVLRDLADGWLRLGYGGTRGRGHIEVTRVRFDGQGLDAPWQSLTGTTLDAVLADPPPDITAAMSSWAGTFEKVSA